LFRRILKQEMSKMPAELLLASQILFDLLDSLPLLLIWTGLVP